MITSKTDQTEGDTASLSIQKNPVSWKIKMFQARLNKRKAVLRI